MPDDKSTGAPKVFEWNSGHFVASISKTRMRIFDALHDGVATNRDSRVYNFRYRTHLQNVEESQIKFYNSEILRWQKGRRTK